MNTSSLINHLWQSSCFALLAGLLAFVLRKNSPKVRYWVWLSASLKFLLPFALLVGLGSVMPRPDRHTTSDAYPVFPSTLVQISEPFTLPLRTTVPAHAPLDWTWTTIGAVWALGFLVITLVRCRSWLGVRAALRAGTPIQLPIPVQALTTPWAEEPGVVGFLRPVLVLPTQLLEHLNPSQLSAILAHELCHVRRRDNFFAAVHMVVEAIFWFDPLVWWIGSRMIDEREQACDEEVLRMGCEPADYVEGILKVCRLCSESPLPCISGVTGADLKKRLRAILTGSIARKLTVGKKVILAAVGVSVLSAPIAIGVLNAPAIRAQSEVRPKVEAASIKFDVASVKLCSPSDIGLVAAGGRGGGGNYGTSPGRLHVHCMSVDALVKLAYTTNDPLVNSNGAADKPPVRGGPAWTHSSFYSIEAKTEDSVANGPTASASPARKVMTGPMLQSLLEDRFRLKTHRETEEVPMYALTVAKGGLKLKPLEQGCTPPDVTQHPSLADLALPKPPCNTQMGGRKGPNRTNEVVGTLRWLAFALSGIMDRHVIDRTGVTDAFRIHLEYLPDESAAGRGQNGAPVAEPASDIPPGPSIFTALEQIGLRLVPDKGPRGYIVIDHVERPSEN
jgi:bla regulator protein BlaR1